MVEYVVDVFNREAIKGPGRTGAITAQGLALMLNKRAQEGWRYVDKEERSWGSYLIFEREVIVPVPPSKPT